MYYRETIKLFTDFGQGSYDITPKMKEVVKNSGIKNGIVTMEVPHSTAGIMGTTGHCPEVMDDLNEELERLLPRRIDYIHQETPEDATGHIKCALFGNTITAIIENGVPLTDDKLSFFLMEYDGPRHRKVNIAVIGDKE